MKKILLASTALVGFAGAAAAEVSLSAYAELGVLGGDTDTATVGTGETQFHTDIDVTFSMTGASDNGLEFGASIEIDDDTFPSSTNSNGVPEFDNTTVWVSGSFGRITLGETDGALDWAVSEIFTGTSINDDHSTHAGAYWNTGLDGRYDNQVLRYEYSFGDFAAGVSAEIDDTGVEDPSIGIGGKWAGNLGGADVSAGIGFQDNGTNSVWALSAGAAMANGFSVNVGYADLDGTVFHSSTVGAIGAVDSWWGIGAAYTTGALTVGINYGEFDVASGDDASGWGLVANYDLGGGAVAMFGYGSSDCTVSCSSWNGQGESTWSAGLGLSF